MDWWLGIDGGGTKTELVLLSATSGSRRATRVGGTSLSRRPPEQVERELAAGLEALGLGGVGPNGAGRSGVGSVGAGFASAGHPDRLAIYQAMLGRLLPRARVRVTTDLEIAWLGAAGGQDAIVVVGGTGSSAYGRYCGRLARAGGLGPGLDRGSGDWIGREAVRLGLAEAPPEENFADFVPRLAGSAAAAGLFREAGAALADLLAACARELEWRDPRAFYVGGLCTELAEVREALREAWPHALAPAQATPVEGALRMAERGERP